MEEANKSTTYHYVTLCFIYAQVVAETKIEQNAAITLNYGCHPNDFFLLDYGFVITPNPYDQVELSYDGTLLDAASMAAGISSPTFSAPAKWQEDILSQLNLLGEGAILKVFPHS
jgi:hypothetical protein